MKQLLSKLIPLSGLFAAMVFATGANAAESVVLQLPYQIPQFQFAGYYVALEKGYYRDAGVDLELIPTQLGVDITKVVVAGTAQFGVSNAIVLLSRLNGAPLVVLADIMQHSPLVLFARKTPEIQKLSDLEGRKIEIPNIDRCLEIDAMLSHAGISRKGYDQVTDRWSFDDLASGKADAISGYITAQTYALNAKKANYQIFNPRDYGIDYYSDALFTSEDYLKAHGETVEAVRKATLKGWRFAMAHPSEAIDILLRQPETKRAGLTRAQLEYEAKMMEEFVLPNLIQIGEVHVDRWKTIAESFVHDGQAKSTDQFDGFIYDINAVSRKTLITRISLAAAVVVLVGLIILMLNFQLRRLVRLRTSELEETSRQLLHAQKIQAIGTLANGIGHDINNILGIIMLNTNVLLQKSKDPEVLKVINVIRDALERGSRVSKQILQFSNNHLPEPERVNVSQLLEQLRHFLATSLPPSIQMSCRMANRDIWVSGDSTQLYQAFLNLVVNARDALPDKGLIEIDVLAHENTVEVRIRDNGIGMETDVVQRVFEPFFTTKSLGTGTGLGLSIVHGIITSHGGHTKIESEKGKGTIVRVFLPRQRSVIESEENESEPEVLIAEDEVGIRSIVAMALRDEGYRVCVAGDGEEALALFNRHRETLRAVVSDVGLPKLSGNDVLDRLAIAKPSLGLIAISGFVEEGHLRLPPAAQLLQKPFAIEKLVALVVELAGGAASNTVHASSPTSGR